MSISNPSDSAPHGEPTSHVMDQSDRLQSLPTEEHGHPPISTNIALDLAPPDLPQPHTVSPASLLPSNRLRRDENASEEEHAGAGRNENTERPAQDGPFGSDMPPMTGDHASTTESGHRRNEAVATDSSDELPGSSLWTHFTQLLQRIHDSITHVSGDRPVVPLHEESEYERSEAREHEEHDQSVGTENSARSNNLLDSQEDRASAVAVHDEPHNPSINQPASHQETDTRVQSEAPLEDSHASPQEAPANESTPDSVEHDRTSHEQTSPHLLVYIPSHASPFPFSFLYDTTACIAWPVLERAEQPVSDTNGENADTRTVHVLGMPFHISITMRPAPPDEVPDINKARAYVKELEVVDSELRMRMIRFGMSDIGIYGVVDDMSSQGQCVMGCGVCLEPYPTEDKPAWFTEGKPGEDETVVALPCPGFHTIHARCLFDWLSKRAPSKWTCPYCRAPIKGDVSTTKEAMHTIGLREHVRQKEREAGLRCDAPACLPYDSDDEKHRSPLIQLMPCRHEIHLDCLCMGMRIEMAQAQMNCSEIQGDQSSRHAGSKKETGRDLENPDEEEDAVDDNEYAWATSSTSLSTGMHSDSSSLDQDTIGKWVTCSACRKDAWARLPRRRQPRRMPRSVCTNLSS